MIRHFFGTKIRYISNNYIVFGSCLVINIISSWSLDTLLINGIDYTNSWSDLMPERIKGAERMCIADKMEEIEFS